MKGGKKTKTKKNQVTLLCFYTSTIPHTIDIAQQFGIKIDFWRSFYAKWLLQIKSSLNPSSLVILPLEKNHTEGT